VLSGKDFRYFLCDLTEFSLMFLLIFSFAPLCTEQAVDGLLVIPDNKPFVVMYGTL